MSKGTLLSCALTWMSLASKQVVGTGQSWNTGELVKKGHENHLSAGNNPTDALKSFGRLILAHNPAAAFTNFGMHNLKVATSPNTHAHPVNTCCRRSAVKSLFVNRHWVEGESQPQEVPRTLSCKNSCCSSVLPYSKRVLCHVGRRCPAPQALVEEVPLAVQYMTHTSGIDELPFAVQDAAFVGTFAALIASAVTIDKAYTAVQRARPTWWWDAWEIGAALLLGAIFVTAGRSHFTVPEAFMAIYPPQGTWGFWYLPGSAQFHVAWTGIGELCGGSGLLVGGLIEAISVADLSLGDQVDSLVASGKSQLLPFSAGALFFLVLCVTPANFLMFSHGATMPGIVEGPLSMPWHLVRFLAQVSVLSVLLTLSLQGERGSNEQA